MTDKYWTTGGDGLWGNTNNWSLTSGGASGAAVPSASDATFFNASSPSGTVDGASARTCLSLNFTGFTNTITLNQDINVSGAMTFVAAMTIAGSSYFRGIANGTHTSNGKTIPNLWLSNGSTQTLGDNFTVTNYRCGSTTATTTVNSNQISINGNFDCSQRSTGIAAGSALYIMAGTGQFIYPSSTAAICTNSLTINTAGTITFPSGTFRYEGGTLTYTAGTITIASDTDLRTAAAATFNTNGASITFRDWLLELGSVTVTLSSNLHLTRDIVQTTNTGSDCTLNGSAVVVSGGMSSTKVSGSTLGTTELRFVGTGTLSASAQTGGSTRNPVTINTTGTITVSTPFKVDFGQLKYVAGTVITNATWPSGGATGGSYTFGG